MLAIDGNLTRLHRVLDMGSPFRLFEFGIGMTAGYLLVSRPALVPRAARGVVALPIAVAGGALVVIGSTMRIDTPALSGSIAQPMVALGLSLLFLPLAFKRPGRLERGGPGRAVAWVGVISYAVLIANEPLRDVTLRLRFQHSSLDEKLLVGLTGVVQISHVVVHGTSLLNLEAFAPAARWSDSRMRVSLAGQDSEVAS